MNSPLFHSYHRGGTFITMCADRILLLEDQVIKEPVDLLNFLQSAGKMIIFKNLFSVCKKTESIIFSIPTLMRKRMNSIEQNNEDIKAICQFLVDNYETLEEDGSGMLQLDLPSFDLYSWDYLRFAEESIEKHDDGNLVEKLNCV